MFFFDRDESHLGPGDGFADGGGVRCVVFAALAAHAVRADELGGDQFDGVAVLAEQPCPVVCAGAGHFDRLRTGAPADQARRQVGDDVSVAGRAGLWV